MGARVPLGHDHGAGAVGTILRSVDGEQVVEPRPARFGVALIGIMLVIVVNVAGDRSEFIRWLGVVIQGGVLVFVLWTADVRRGTRLIAEVVVAAALVVAAIGVFTPGEVGDHAVQIVALLLVVATPPAIVGRIARQPKVDGTVVAGALCIYLLLGLAYSVGYVIIDGLMATPFFAQDPDPSHSAFTYFSFVTLTTVGYGDLSPAGDVGRLAAITEALLGQLYLVTVVALVVSRIGQERRERT